MTIQRCSIGTLVLAVAFSTIAAAQQTQPLEVGLEEQVEVQLVLVDFLVVDRDGRTVPDLTLDDFKLKVDGRSTEIASLDLDCPIGAADELVANPGDPLPSTVTDRVPGKIVLVFDYDHMINEANAFARILDLLDRWPEGPEEHMIVSLGEVVRVETPFTTDRDELRWAIRRMRNDRDLFARPNSRLTEERFFDRILSLMDILQRYEGRKTIVLMSGPFVADGWTQDRALRELSGMSTIARAAVYPVDTGGLRAPDPDDPTASIFGGPPELRRLANETGGRMTSETNDITLAYAKAQRDMRCTYTLGVYDRSGKLNNKRRLTLKIKKRRGLRVVYPQFFLRQSEGKRKKSLLRTAGLAPQLFESAGIRSAHFVVGAEALDSWTTLLAMEISLAEKDLGPTSRSWNVTGFLRKMNGTVVEKFDRELVVPALVPGRKRPLVATLYHELQIAPGEYAFSVVVSVPEDPSPRSATHLVRLVQPPRKGPFVIGPILGRQSHDATSTNVDFRPSFDGEAARGQSLDAMTVLCVAGEDRGDDHGLLRRSIATLDGEEVHRYEQVPVALSRGKRLGCATWVDPISTGDLTPGAYEFLATAESDGVKTRLERAQLELHPPTDEAGQ